jgi:arsenite methyltransferase
MAQIEFNEAIVRALERVYQSRDIVWRRGLARGALAAQPGERILDIGCGPGFYVTELLEEVGPEGSVVGIDSSPDMLAVARHRAEGKGQTDFHEADAVALPVGDAEFDAALSVQVFEYVTDVEAALAEVLRVLRPGGRAVLWDIDWKTLSIRTADEERMRRVLDAWDEHLADPALPRTLAPRMRAAGFEDVTVQGHVFATIELMPEAFGGYLVPFIEGFVGGRGTVPGDELKAWGDEQRELGERGEFYFSVTQFCFTGRKSG